MLLRSFVLLCVSCLFLVLALTNASGEAVEGSRNHLRYPSQNSAYEGNAELLLINKVADFRRCLGESTPETEEESEAKESEADETVMDEEDTEGEESEVTSTDESKYELERQEEYFDYEAIHEQLKIPVPALRASLMKVMGTSADMREENHNEDI